MCGKNCLTNDLKRITIILVYGCLRHECKFEMKAMLYRLMTWTPEDAAGEPQAADTPTRDFKRSESIQSVHSQNSILSQEASHQKIPTMSECVNVHLLCM